MIKPNPIPENMERMYDPEEDDFILVPKTVLLPANRTRAKPQTAFPFRV